MGKISQEFINNLGSLYEEINVQQNDFLNEESEYYDEEATELVEDILSSISLSMVYEGYSASAVIAFLADSSEEEIIEKYLSFDDNLLSESNVDGDYIKEQFELLENKLRAAASLGKAALKTLFGKGLGYVPTKLQGPRAPGLVDKGKVLFSKSVQKVKDIASKAKTVLPKVAKGLGIFGLGAAGGYMGAKLAGGGGDGKVGPKIVGPKIVGPKIVGPKIVGPKSSSPSDGGGGSNSSGGGGSSSTPSSGSPKPAPSKPTGTPMQQWAKANPTLAAKVKPGQSGYEDIQKLDLPQLNTPRPEQKQDQTPTQGPSTAKIDTKDADNALKAEVERQKERLKQQNKTPVTTKESYEPYDVILNYLLSEGHADTLDEANYIMLEMDETAIGIIMKQYEDYLLAEEIQEWVNVLVEEGYDLSQYTWDDMIEYYVNEAKEDEELTPLQKIRKRNKAYAIPGEPAGQQTSNRRAERSSQRGVKKQKGEKSAFGTMRHVGGPYK